MFNATFLYITTDYSTQGMTVKKNTKEKNEKTLAAALTSPRVTACITMLGGMIMEQGINLKCLVKLGKGPARCVKSTTDQQTNVTANISKVGEKRNKSKSKKSQIRHVFMSSRLQSSHKHSHS